MSQKMDLVQALIVEGMHGLGIVDLRRNYMI